jgi:hypothetical protein
VGGFEVRVLTTLSCKALENVVDKDCGPNRTLEHRKYNIPKSVYLIDEIYSRTNEGNEKGKTNRTITLVYFYKVVFTFNHSLIVAPRI